MTTIAETRILRKFGDDLEADAARLRVSGLAS